MQHMVDTHTIKAMDLYLGLIFFNCGLWVTLDNAIGQSQESSHQPHSTKHKLSVDYMIL